MDERILVEVYLPIVQRSIDVYLPLKAELSRCKEAWTMYLKEQTTISVPQDMLLYDEQHDMLLNEQVLVEQSALQRGSRIICM